MSILKLVLQISGSSCGPSIRVEASPAGSSDPVAFRAPLDDDDLAAVARAVVGQHDRSRLRHLLSLGRSEPSADLLRVGWKLTRPVFQRPLADAFLSSLGPEGASEESPLRIEIRIDRSLPEAGRLQALPWELLLHPRLGSPLVLNPWTQVVRYLDVPRAEGKPPRPETLSILAVAPQPLDAPPLAIDRELAELRCAWSGADGVELSVLEAPTFDALHEELARRRIDVLHFMGHGRFDPEADRGVLLFEDDLRRSDPVDADLLASDVEPWARNLRLVVLNACGSGAGGVSAPTPDGWMEAASLPRRASGVAAALVGAGVPAVVAMQLPVSDRAALEISRALYRSLAAGTTIDVAVAEARSAVRRTLRGSGEWMTPALFLRTGDGHLFAPAAPARAGVDAPPRRPEAARWAGWAGLAGLAGVLLAALVAGYLAFGPAGRRVGRADAPGSAGPDRNVQAAFSANAPDPTTEEEKTASPRDEVPPAESASEPKPAPAVVRTVADGETVSLEGVAATLSVSFLSIEREEFARVTVAPDVGEPVPNAVFGPGELDVPAGERTIRIQVTGVDFDRRTVTLKALSVD